MHILDTLIISGYLLLCLFVGLRKTSAIKNIKEYAIGKGHFPAVILVATTFATSIGVASTIGRIEKTYELGLVFIIPNLCMPIGWLILSRIMANSIEDFRGCLTLSDIMARLYGPLGRWITNIASIIITLGMITVCVSAIGDVINYFTGMKQIYGALIGISVIILYSAIGGIQGVASTDVFQLIIFLIAFPFACSIGYHDVGGFSTLWEKLPDTHKLVADSRYSYFTSLIFYYLIPLTSVAMIQRALMAENKQDLKKSFDTVALITFPFICFVSLIALITYVKNPNLEPRIALFYFINNYLPIGMIGLMVASMLAVIMSTADSLLNATSTICARDIIKKLMPKLTETQELNAARISSIVLAIIAFSIAYKDMSIMNMIWLVDNFWDPLVSIPFLLGMLKVRPGENAYKIAVLLSMIGIIFTKINTGKFDTISISIGTLLSGFALYSYAKLNGNQKLQNLHDLHR